MGLILGSESKTLAFLFTVNLNRAKKGFILQCPGLQIVSHQPPL